MALDEAVTPLLYNGAGTAPAPLAGAGRGGGSHCNFRFGVPQTTDGKAWPDPPSLTLPHKGGGNARSGFVAIGVGYRAGVSGEAIAALVRRALAEFGAPEGERRLFTLAAKAEEAGLVEAARLIGAKLTPLPLAALAAEAERILTSSPVVQLRFGVPSIAEAAALAGAGAGGKLLGPRLAADGATCAVAVSAELS
jgi:cobalt-precorrin 5A hydrolase